MKEVVSALNGLMRGVVGLWNKGCLGKIAVGLIALLILGICGAIAGRGQTTRPTPTAVSLSSTTAPREQQRATAQPATPSTAQPSVTLRPWAVPTEQPKPSPTAIKAPTNAPARATAASKPATDPAGVPPVNKDDCPQAYPVKGNIRGDGEKIYHVPGGRSYGATDPERCFATSADAEAAGFRPAQ